MASYIIRMKFHKNKFLTAIAAVALALAVGACSSNGDDEMSDMDTAPTETTDPTPEPTAAEQLTAAKEKVMAAEAMVDALTNSSTADEAAAAYAALGEAQTALHAANSLPENQIAAKQAEIDVLQAQVDQLTIDLAEATKEPDPPTEAEMAATEAAGTKVEAIGDEAAQMTDDGPGGADADPDHMIDIKRDRAGTTVTVTVGGAATDDPEFVDQMAGLDRGRTMLVRAMEADEDGNVVEEVVIVSTDIEAPKATAFAKVDGQALNARDLDDDVNADDMGEADDDWTALWVGVDGNTAPIDDVLKLVMSGAFVPGEGTSTELTFARAQEDSDSNTAGDQTVEAFETAGTYNGAMGTYRCGAPDTGGSDCMVTVNAKGELTAMSTGWVFTPAMGATSDVPDGDGYLSYGFWLERTKDADGVVTSYGEVETFAMATTEIGETVASTLEVVTGSATYEGGSVGVYVKNVLDDQANIVSATSGHFSADVELTATFGGGDVADNNQFTIGGKITDFVLQHGEENDWGVGLGLADFSGRPENDPGKSEPGNTYTDMFSGVATGDSTAVAGSWNGMFHGVSGNLDHDGDGDTPTVNTPPVAVTGEFSANFTDGTAAGGFGANTQ